ncbi:proline-rich proteoglycan 2-like [Synchiropus splendidus]|uniref:proline-rich proteoglycan 2-like n=1 Tax=Synchiropus splendidus TaxID=270530 RepID=UPI00237DDE36|nr:proline-rich proteoglycan 2-like [Synchiropus splendidus]
MIFTILLSCLTVTVTAVPVSSPAADVPNQKLTVEAPAQPCPNLDPSQNALPQQQQQQLLPQQQLPQQQLPQSGPALVPQMQQYNWPPLGGSPLLVPLQPSGAPALPVNQPSLSQQPLVFPPYGYFPVFMPPYTNQVFPQYRIPLMPEAQLPQTPGNPPPNPQVQPAEPPAGPVSGAEAPQTTQQQQNPQIVYMIPQPKGPALGGLSSEELAMAAELGQLSAYLPSLLHNPGPEVAAPVSQTAGLAAKADAPPSVHQQAS